MERNLFKINGETPSEGGSDTLHKTSTQKSLSHCMLLQRRIVMVGNKK